MAATATKQSWSDRIEQRLAKPWHYENGCDVFYSAEQRALDLITSRLTDLGPSLVDKIYEDWGDGVGSICHCSIQGGEWHDDDIEYFRLIGKLADQWDAYEQG